MCTRLHVSRVSSSTRVEHYYHGYASASLNFKTRVTGRWFWDIQVSGIYFPLPYVIKTWKNLCHALLIQSRRHWRVCSNVNVWAVFRAYHQQRADWSCLYFLSKDCERPTEKHSKDFSQWKEFLHCYWCSVCNVSMAALSVDRRRRK